MLFLFFVLACREKVLRIRLRGFRLHGATLRDIYAVSFPSIIMGTYLPAQSGEAYAKTDDFFGGKAIYQDLSKWVGEIPAVSYGAYTYEADAAVMAQIDAFCKGSVTVDKALADAQAQVEVQIG